MSRWWGIFVSTALLAVVLVAERPQAATIAPELRINVSEGQLLTLPRPVQSVFVADPEIADVQPQAPTRIFVFGKRPGRTTLFALDADGDVVLQNRVRITYSDEDLRALVAAEVGRFPVTMTYTPGGAVLSGTVPTAADAERARSIARTFLGEGMALVNELVVTGAVQVNLRVRVAEISRTALRELGINWNVLGNAGDFTFGLLTGRAIRNAAGQVIRSATGAASLFGRVTTDSVDATGLIDAFADEGLATVLAEPNLVAVSGQAADFLAGGEYPIPIAQANETISVEYRRFGVALRFVPTVLSDDIVSIQVAPEVSELTNEGAVQVRGFSIPALTVRRAATTVELGSGQSFVIAGLIRNNFSTGIEQVPLLGDVPVLGALFRSSRFQRSETELAIIVTPFIVRPIGDPASVIAPTDLVSAPSDVERILSRRLAGVREGPALIDRLQRARLKGDTGFLID